MANHVYRICRAFTVESGHMLSKHPERCKIPHGHTRRIEIVLRADKLDENDMVVDFKSIKLAIGAFIEQFDHSTAMNTNDPNFAAMSAAFGDGIIPFEGQDPTTEVIAEAIFTFVAEVLRDGWSGESQSGATYQIPADTVELERVRVWETPNSWAEYGEASNGVGC